MNQDFKPINCRKCGTVIWTGISWAGFQKRLDTATLTIEEEILKRISKVMTFECFKTKVSFEAVERSLNRIRWGKNKASVILAEHTCSSLRMIQTEAPEYWANRGQKEEAPY